MIQEYTYKNETYEIIEAFSIGEIYFAIGKDSHDKLSYMKMTQLEVKTVFTPLDKLIQVLDDYKNQRVYNVKKILDYFVNKLNISIEKKRIKICDINHIIIDFVKFVNDYYIFDDHEISFTELKKIDHFVSSYQSKPLILKMCNVYGLMLLVSIIGIGFFSRNLFVWYNEGKTSKDIVTDIVADTDIEETKAFEDGEVAAILDDKQVSEKNVDVDKYSYNYWVYSNTTIMSVDFDELKKVNPDTVGWLYVNNTKINYPIVQSGDNNFYLSHSFKKAFSAAGWIFADFRSNLTNLEKNTVIYGHGRLDNVMFGSLDDTLKSSWYTNPENHIIKLSTPSKNMLWQIFSIYTIPSESYYLTHTFENDESYSKFLNTIMGRSIYNFNVGVNTDDHILTLSTCLDNNGNRIVVHAKLIKSEER